MKPEETSWEQPTDYHSYYNMTIFGYVDMMCCVLSTISNTLIILVFTRNTPVSPMNTIFIHMAVTESLTVFSFIPRSYHEYFRVKRCSIDIHRTEVWENFALNSYKLTFLFRHMVVWLMVMLGVWRYIAVVHPLKKSQWCDMRITRKLIIAGYIFGFIIAIPPYFCTAVQPSNILLDEEGCLASNSTIGNKIINTTIYEFKVPVENFPFLYTFLMITYGVFIKSLPAIVLSVISYKLIFALIEARKRRVGIVANLNRKYMEKQTDPTEIPHGICATLTGILGPKFYWGYYYYVMEIGNCFTHISTSFNFVFYYTMSSQFRKNFKALFKRNGNRSSHDGHRISSVAQRGITEIEHLEI
ncbi:sex peptide receptor-related protein 2-like [Planococcus citri]|uniref:sex peptide receptor-related protein 2-like n=1 Tax=Planococcus citri TaxID=170843 RepID=UPI0031F9D1CF